MTESVATQYFCNVLGPTGQTEAHCLLGAYYIKMNRSGTAFKLHKSSPLWELTGGYKVKFWYLEIAPQLSSPWVCALHWGFFFPLHKVLLSHSPQLLKYIWDTFSRAQDPYSVSVPESDPGEERDEWVVLHLACMPYPSVLLFRSHSIRWLSLVKCYSCPLSSSYKSPLLTPSSGLE